MNLDKIKMVVFDLNETLISENTWLELNLAMGVKPEEDEQFMKWYEEGIISYEEGQRFLERIYRARGRATKDKIMSAMKYTFRDGARELIDYLHQKGYKVALLSGAIDMLVEKVAGELNIDMFAAHNKINFGDDGLFKNIECVGDDSDFKINMTKIFCDQMKISTDQVVCVGDAYNDVKLFNETGHGITFSNAKITDSAWKVVSSLLEIKEIL